MFLGGNVSDCRGDVKVLHLSLLELITMPTKNPRINITFDKKTAAILATLSSQEHKSVASIAKELILDALERREDLALSALAEMRDNKDAEKVEHEDVWK